MTKVRVDPGICGYPATIKVRRVDKSHVDVHIACACDQIQAFAAKIADTDWREALRPMAVSSVYQAASGTIRHATCPLPMAVLKAVEAEIGAALPKDMTMHFIAEAPGAGETSPIEE